MEIDLRESGPLALGLMRIVLGFMLVWAFLDKMFGLGFPSPSSAAVINGGSPTEYYLNVSVMPAVVRSDTQPGRSVGSAPKSARAVSRSVPGRRGLAWA